MRSPSTALLCQFIEKNIPDFHRKRLERLAGLKLREVLRRKNPYLFKAKNIESASELVKQLLDAHLSSQEETIFGGFLESLAIFVCQQTYGGYKSAAEGIDLEFERDGMRYLVAIESGPNWANSSQMKKLGDYFRQAKKIVGRHHHVIAVNGCCYGRGDKDHGDYLKLCGQSFWSLISGNDAMYQEIIEPLGHRAREKNEESAREYARVANRFTAEFIRDYCTPDGAIDWEKIVTFNSARTKPERARGNGRGKH
ncbi:MAG: PmeII family type II restriction endonuclease [Rhodocyclaceae bacterium]